MLSNENPPPDSSFPCEISQPKSTTSRSNGNEKASADKLDVDLLKSCLDDNHPLPKFSIRDYVLQERAKDIHNSWPFSQQKLHLCLKHGVQDVLPPFQSPDSVRNTSSDFGVNKEKLASCTEEDKQLPSTTRSLKDPHLEPVGKPESAIRVALKKVQSNVPGPVNKSRLTLKLKSIAEPGEDSAFDTSLAPEPMASQVCPVCRIFSSSSNTTLNAHIDQCLSEEPTNKWQTNSGVVKHKTKARKVRLMVDIYKTALCCTLEDLDRRNGTNWASNTSLPAQDFDTFDEEKSKRCSSVHREGITDKGGVYIDSNGMKLRILSKLGDIPTSSNADDGCSGNKPLTNRKIKYLLREQKFPNPCHGRGGGSSALIANKHAELEITGQQKDFIADGCKEDHLILDDSVKSEKLGRVRQCEGSKQTRQKKEVTRETESMYTERKTPSLKANKVLSSLGEKQFVPSGSQILSCGSPDRILEQIYWRKRPGFSSAKYEECLVKKRRLLFSKSNSKHSSKDCSFHHRQHVGSPSGFRNLVSSRSKTKSGLAMKGDRSCVGVDHPTFPSTGKESASLRTTSGKKKLSPLGKKLSSIRHDSVRELKKNLGRKRLNMKKKHLVNYTSESDDDIFGSRSVIYYRKYNLPETLDENAGLLDRPSDTRSKFLKLRKKRWLLVNSDKNNMSSNDSEISLESDRSCSGYNTPSDDVPVDASSLQEEADRLDESTREPTYETADGEAFAAYSKSLDFAYPAGPSNVRYYEGRHPCELVLSEGEMFHTDKLGQDFVTPNSHVLGEMDSQQHSYVDVDPIPIPGPPGSFLPSPGRVGSEELQGNSSLTTSRIHSSENEHDVDSSDSPVSATSSLSNTNPAGTNQVPLDMHLRVQQPTQGVISEKAAYPKRQVINLHESRTNVMLPNVSTHEFNNCQPCCCCLGKDAASRNASLNYRDSQFMEQSTAMGYDPNEKDYIFSSIASMGGPRGLVSHNFEAQHPPVGDSGSPSPSASNPVLRLMGKNLMVVNKDDNISPQNRSTPVQMDISSLSTDINNRNEMLSSNPTSSRAFASIPTQYFHVHPTSGYKEPANFCQPVMFSPHSTTMFPSNCVGAGSASSSKVYENADGCNFIIRRDAWTTYDNEKLSSPTPPPCHHGTSVNAFYGYPTREYPLSTVSPIPPDQMDPNMSRWNITAEGSWMNCPNPQIAAPLPRCLLHFSPGFP